ncbi:MAG: hypothetical protein ACPIOQ_53525 [Promethearchaeia archaeon]
MLDTAFAEDEREMGPESIRHEGARLSCQVEMTPALDGLVVLLPESMHNMLEIPLWLRKR